MSSQKDRDAMKRLTARILEFRLPDTTHSTPELISKSMGTSLLERTRKLLETIPMEQQEYGLELNELRIRLRGRIKKTCHPGELADCLRKLAYTRKRYWRNENEGFQARWFPKY